MKKVKVMLASIAVLAVIGGAFAFKAKSAFGKFIYTTTTTANGATCSVKLLNSTTTPALGAPLAAYYTVAGVPAPCATNVTSITTAN